MRPQMGIQWDPKTRIYSARISIGEKESLSPKEMRVAIRRAIMGMSGQLAQRIDEERDRELTEILFWCEEGWI